jgi:hypothetical protein
MFQLPFQWRNAAPRGFGVALSLIPALHPLDYRTHTDAKTVGRPRLRLGTPLAIPAVAGVYIELSERQVSESLAAWRHNTPGRTQPRAPPEVMLCVATAALASGASRIPFKMAYILVPPVRLRKFLAPRGQKTANPGSIFGRP